MPYSSIRDHMRYEQIGAQFRQQVYAMAGLFTNHVFISRGQHTPLRDDVIKSFGFTGTNKPGKMNYRGGAPNLQDAPSLQTMSSGLLRQHDVTRFTNDQLRMFLRSPNTFGGSNNASEYDPAAQSYTNQVIDMGVRQSALAKELAFAQAAVTGYLFCNADNEILIPEVDDETGVVSTPAGTTRVYNFGLPNSMRGNLGGIIDKLWSDPTAIISAQLDKIQLAAKLAGRAKPNVIWVPKIQRKHLRVNTEFKTWAVNNQQSVETLLGGDMIENLWGWKWVFTDDIYMSKYDESSEMLTLPLTNVHMFSEQESFIETYDGCELLHFGPTGIMQAGPIDLQQLDLTEVFGDFAYTELTGGPSLSLGMHRGSNFGINIKRASLWNPYVFAPDEE